MPQGASFRELGELIKPLDGSVGWANTGGDDYLMRQEECPGEGNRKKEQYFLGILVCCGVENSKSMLKHQILHKWRLDAAAAIQ